MFEKKTTSPGRLPQMSKVIYLSNYLSDHPQILNFVLYDQSKLYLKPSWVLASTKSDKKVQKSETLFPENCLPNSHALIARSA
jgi:hypothetical protein